MPEETEPTEPTPEDRTANINDALIHFNLSPETPEDLKPEFPAFSRTEFHILSGGQRHEKSHHSYEYNENGLVDKVENNETGETNLFNYDTNNRLTMVFPEGRNGTREYAALFAYNEAGELETAVRLFQRNIIKCDYQKEKNGSITENIEGKPRSRYSFNEQGRLEKYEVLNDQGETHESWQYQYDEGGRKTKETHTHHDGKETYWGYRYDEKERLVTIAQTDKEGSPLKNRLTKTEFKYEDQGEQDKKAA